MGKFYDLYVRFMVFLGAEAPEGYEYLLTKAAPPPKKVAPPKPPTKKAEPAKPVAEKPKPPVVEKPKPPVAEKPKPPVVEKPQPPVVEKPKPPVAEKPQPPIAEKPKPPVIEKVEPTPRPTYQVDPVFPPIGPLDATRALYVSYEALGQADQRQKMFEWLDKTEFNAVVIDAKADNSCLSYPSQVPIAKEIGAAQPSVENFADIMAELKRRKVYTIARLVMFKDDLFAHNYPEYAVKIKGTKALWRDHENLSWSDPFLTPVWGYNLQIATEAAQWGFDEILFDYLRFPTTSQVGEPYFSQELTRESRVSAITGFLSTARGQLNPFGVKVAMSLAGYACWRKDDMLIGQDIERLAQYVDVLCPMLYPSTFNKGIPGYKEAIAHPYEVVCQTAQKAVTRINGFGCTVRPWIQDFPDYTFDQRVYGKTEIQQQIKGCFDSGSLGFMAWNPQTKYTAGAYAPVIKSV